MCPMASDEFSQADERQRLVAHAAYLRTVASEHLRREDMALAAACEEGAIVAEHQAALLLDEPGRG